MLILSKSKYLLLSALTAVTLITGCSSNQITKQDIKEYRYPAAPDEARFYFDRMLRTNLSVEFETEDEQIKRYLTGASRKAQGMLKPFDIAVHGSRIFVSDPPARKVHIFDVAEFFYDTIKEPLEGALSQPMGIDVDAQGNLYIMDAGVEKIYLYDRDGNYINQLGEDSFFERPTGLAVTADGRKVYVSNTGGVSSQKHDVIEVDVQTGELTQTIGTRGKDDLQFNLPKDIEWDDELGHLYVVDSANFRVQVIDVKNQTLVRKFGSIGRQLGQFSRPKGISIDKDKNVYVSDAAFGNYQIFNPEGRLLMFVGQRGNQLEPGVYMLNSGITVDEDGRVLVADQYHRKVDIFRPAALKKTDGNLAQIENLTEEKYLQIKADIANKKSSKTNQ
ncbi:hypothetical protein [Thalassotalea aquiviva]|uniref:hypothetical protein n=1 Tax=Thalassotalea aquiviva TaxID=3242415 RepID=UPI00352A0A37